MISALFFNFDDNDIVIGSSGSFVVADTGNQNVALIAMSQVCRVTYPEIGVQLGSRIVNQRSSSANAIISEAVRAAETDGATDVAITLSGNDIQFKGTYES